MHRVRGAGRVRQRAVRRHGAGTGRQPPRLGGRTRRVPTDTLPGLVPRATARSGRTTSRSGSRAPSLQVRAIPLDESIIRLLSPDSYRRMPELKREQDATRSPRSRDGTACASSSLWYVSFFAVEPGKLDSVPRVHHHERRPRLPSARRHSAHARVRRAAASAERHAGCALRVRRAARRAPAADRVVRDGAQRRLGDVSCRRSSASARS